MPRFDEWDREFERGPFDTGMNPPPPEEEGFASTNPPDDGFEQPPVDFGEWNPPSYSGPWAPSFNFEPVPRFNPRMFNAPSFEDAQNEPGYQHRLASGTNALERSAAARGVLRTGGTLKDLLEYGQNFAAQEYNNVYNRALQAYGAQYQAERDMFAPLFAQWQNRFGAEQASGMASFDRSWDAYALMAQLQAQREQMALQAAMSPPPPDRLS